MVVEVYADACKSLRYALGTYILDLQLGHSLCKSLEKAGVLLCIFFEQSGGRVQFDKGSKATHFYSLVGEIGMFYGFPIHKNIGDLLCGSPAQEADVFIVALVLGGVFGQAPYGGTKAEAPVVVISPLAKVSASGLA